MGITGENVAEKYGITREEQDEFALNSHRKALAAMKECRFKSQIVPVELPTKKKGAPPVIFEKDEGPREDTTIEVLRSLKPAFKKDGTVTAGNAPGVNDGAAAVVVTSADRARDLGAKPMVRIVAQATSGVEPKWVMMAPVGAIKKIWEKTGWKKDEVDLYELNEAFSVQALGVIRELGLDMAPGILGAYGGLNKKELLDSVFVGELSLDGGVRGIRGTLPIAIEARGRKLRRLIVPAVTAREAAMQDANLHAFLGKIPNLSRDSAKS